MTSPELPFAGRPAASAGAETPSAAADAFVSGLSALLSSLAAARLVEASAQLAANDPASGGWVRPSFAIPTDAYAVLAHRATDERLTPGLRRTQNDLALIAIRAFLQSAPQAAEDFLALMPPTAKRARGDRPATTTLTVRLPAALLEYLVALGAFTSTSPAQIVAAAILAAKRNRVWEA